jgi:NitT/TauT family transport system ATP-binding protein
MSGLIEALAAPPYNGEADLAELGRTLRFEIDDLLPVADALSLLHFAEVKDGEIKLTPDGLQFAELDLDDRKALFAEHMLHYVALAAHIHDILTKREGHQAPLSRFKDELEDHLSQEAADGAMRAVIAWGRFAELFTYDSRTETFSLTPAPTETLASVSTPTTPA